MTDPIRSKIMRSIKSKDTKPELLVRRGLHKKGFRYRVHSKTLVGHPDIVLRRYKAIVLVNGCFWHGHSCHIFKIPKQEKWREKIQRNRVRDEINKLLYETSGWRVLEIWECALFGKTALPTEEVISSAAAWIQFGDSDAEITGKNQETH